MGAKLAPESRTGEGLLVLGIDTCGPSGTVALARIEEPKGWAPKSRGLLAQMTLAGRTYSATLVQAVAELMADQGAALTDLGAIVTVNGPGSFTGIRVGVSAVKGLAEPGDIPVVAVSRLAVLAAVAAVPSAALNAHRQEVYLYLSMPDGSARQCLAGAGELAKIDPLPAKVAVCDDGAAELIKAAWNKTELVRTREPTAADAIRKCAPSILAGECVNLTMLDGLYLRRSDAEIFGDSPERATDSRRRIRVRLLKPGDIDEVLNIARALDQAANWPRQAWEKAVDASEKPGRIALGAEDCQSGALLGFAVACLTPPEAELESIATTLAHQRQGVARALFSWLRIELHRQGIVSVTLEVRAENRAALGFYRTLGFVPQGRRPAYYTDPVEDAVLMRLSIA